MFYDRRSKPPVKCPLRGDPWQRRTPNCTVIPSSRCSTAHRRPTSWSSAPPPWGWRRSPSPTTRVSMARSASPRQPRKRASGRSSGSRSSSSTRRCRIRPGSSSRPGGRSGAAVGRPSTPPLRHGRGFLRDRVRVEPGCRATGRSSRRTCAGSARRSGGPHLVLLARDAAGYRSLARLVSRANLAGTKAVPRFDHALLAAHTEGLVALSGCRHGEIARRLRAGDREGARAVAETYARWFGGRARRVARWRTPASSSSSSTTCCPTTTGSSPRARTWRRSSGCRSSSPTTSTMPIARAASSTTS